VDLSSLGDVITRNVTFENDVANTKRFLQETPLSYQNSEEYAAHFLARGLDAARTISNAYNVQFDAGYKPVTYESYGQDSGGSYRGYLAPVTRKISL
jgi:hypothetical protein